MIVSFLCMQKIYILMSIFFCGSEKRDWTLPCHPNAHWFGGSDGGFFFDIKHEKPPNYYVSAYNESGSLLFKGTIFFPKEKLKYNYISGLKSEYDKNFHSWFVILKNNNVVKVTPQQETEFLNGKK